MDDDYNLSFLVGQPTSVAGSYLRRAEGKPFPHLACGEATCSAYGETHVECRACTSERWRRRILKRESDDPRVNDRFKRAVTLCDTNDVRCDIAAQRAKQEAAAANARLRFIAAVDSAETDDNRYGTAWQRRADKARTSPLLTSVPVVLRNRALPYSTVVSTYFLNRQVLWTQQHDKCTNDLPGSIPVAPGVTVLLTKHLDRGSKALLKGRRGTIDSVEPDPREPPIDLNDTERHRFRYLPKIVYVRFDNASWKLPGLEPGVYPVRPDTVDWYTDQSPADRQKRKPGGNVKRRQFPITAGLAATIH